MKQYKSNITDISWEEIQKYTNDNESYKGFFEQIPLSVYKMTLNKKDRPEVINAILKVLRKNDAKNVSEEYAQIIADRMQKLAMEIISRKSNK
jgi:hypothetical protein